MSTRRGAGIVAADPDRFGQRPVSCWNGSVTSKSEPARLPLVAQEDVRTALIRQWVALADAADQLDLSAPSRCGGWTNREVLAHLYVQPHLVGRFLRTKSAGKATLGVTENLAGTGSFSELIDASARQGAALHKVELRGPLDAVRPLVLGADLGATITTLQGSISVSDYLVTRFLPSRQIPLPRPSPRELFWTHCAPQSPSWLRRQRRSPSGSGSMLPRDDQGPRVTWRGSYQ
jgi:hypothetical protein